MNDEVFSNDPERFVKIFNYSKHILNFKLDYKINSRNKIKVIPMRSIFIIIMIAYSLSAIAQPTDSIRQKREEAVSALIMSIENTYVDQYRGCSKHEWEERKKEIYLKVDSCKTDKEYYLTLSYLGLLIDDVHFGYDFYNYTDLGVFNNSDIVFPIHIKSWQKDGRLFVDKDYSETISSNAEIIFINGLSAQALSKRFHKINTSEERFAYYQEDHHPRSLFSFMNYLSCERIEAPYEIEYILPDKITLSKVTLSGKTRKEMYKYVPHFKGFGKPSAYTKIDDTIGVLKISSFSGFSMLKLVYMAITQKMNNNDKRFVRSINSSIKQLAAHSPDNLIIDIRGNGGGSMENVAYAMSFLSNKRIKNRNYFRISDENRTHLKSVLVQRYDGHESLPHILSMVDTIKSGSYLDLDSTFQAKSNADTLSGSKYIFNGKVYLLCDGGCNSAAILFVNAFKALNVGLLVGSSPGGYNVVTTGESYRKVKSKIFMSIPFGYINPSEKQEYIKMDYPIEPRLDEWVNNNDLSLPRLIEAIKNGDICNVSK